MAGRASRVGLIDIDVSPTGILIAVASMTAIATSRMIVVYRVNRTQWASARSCDDEKDSEDRCLFWASDVMGRHLNDTKTGPSLIAGRVCPGCDEI